MRPSLATPTIELPEFVPTSQDIPDKLHEASEDDSSDEAQVAAAATAGAVSEAAVPTVDSLTDFLPTPFLETLPEVPDEDQEGSKVLRSVYHSRGYHIGKPVRICNQRTGSKVDALVIDSNADQVKLFYMIGSRGYTQVACASVLNMGTPASKRVTPGSTVQVRSSTANAWFKGSVMWSKDDFVKVIFRHNGRSCTKILPRNSPDLRVLSDSVRTA